MWLAGKGAPIGERTRQDAGGPTAYGELHQQMMLTMLHARRDADQVLTPEQRRHLQQRHEQRSGAGGGEHGTGMQCPMMPGDMQAGAEYQHRLP
jgi:hypothetical protein